MRLGPTSRRIRDRTTGVVYHLDRALGLLIEEAQRTHHRRRLRRRGWGRVFDPSDGTWASGEPPPRCGNQMDILIDGSEVLPAIIEALRGASSQVGITGWHADGDFVLQREPPLTLKQLLGEVAQRVPVRVLLWAGVPLPLPTPFFPSRTQIRALSDELTAETSVKCALDAKERTLHCHHEKLVIVDNEIAFVGGLDLTTLGGDRNDSSNHPVRDSIGWHDAAVSLRGPVVNDVADHFAMRWEEVTGERLPAATTPAPAGHTDAQIVRTIPEKVYSSVHRGDFRILEAYLRALSSSRRTIYLESQFLWSQEVVELLKDKLRNPPTDDFRVVTVLPSKPESGADDTLGQLARLVEADNGARRFLACCLYTHNEHNRRPVYVHAKIGIVDDRWLTIGSANLNSHSFYNDTEVNVVTCDPRLATSTRLRLWAEHLETTIEAVSGDPTRVIDDLIRPTAGEQLERLERGLVPTCRLVALRGVSRRSKRLLGPLQSLVVDA